ncbi:hypothetical protein KIPB_014702 [Kipferlia bialata]|uniref:Uncharacterized protein n=1 Tax=Kipferlia bialata TaxID=797122 RepID=A0A9K3DB42_9EUKA|nr:hypothetical protein KIPB_014702 [Kipferlia bialata]|eukprot:g14702.t1
MVSRFGMDVGSTTCKMVVLDDQGDVLFKKYTRHCSDVSETVSGLFEEAAPFLQGQISGYVTGPDICKLSPCMGY